MKTKYWKDIPGYEGYYEVSNFGEIRSKERTIVDCNGKVFHKHSRNISVTDNGNGYKIVSLNREGKRKNYYVHRIVADAFIPKVKGKDHVNHKDFNRGNNNVHNLEWCNRSENMTYSGKNVSKGKRIKNKGKLMLGIYARRLPNGAIKHYRVAIGKTEVKCCKNLKDAIRIRDRYLEEINYYE